MFSSRSIFAVFGLGLGLMFALGLFPFGLPIWIPASGLTLFAGLIVGLIIGRARGDRPRNTAAGTPSETVAKSADKVNFSSLLLNATLDEMREGLLVIDHEMRVVASNRSAHDLFSNVGESINSSRLTELTRNPAIYDAFLDGVRGIERVGVKVEMHGTGRRVFDLRVAPLRVGDDRTPD
ncbi:MAG: hypothetical protein ACMG6H_00145, partial [Acidobacteriota bacterium]